MGKRIALVVWLSLVLAISLVGLAYAESVEEIKPIFERYCTACHNGQRAAAFDQLLGVLREWAIKYPDIDTAARSEYGASYDEMMRQMKGWAPTIPDEEFKKLYDFFIAYFKEAKKTGAAGLVVTVTVTSPVTVTATSPIYMHSTLTVKEGAPEETTKLISWAAVVGAVIVVVATMILAYRLKAM